MVQTTPNTPKDILKNIKSSLYALSNVLSIVVTEFSMKKKRYLTTCRALVYHNPILCSPMLCRISSFMLWHFTIFESLKSHEILNWKRIFRWPDILFIPYIIAHIQMHCYCYERVFVGSLYFAGICIAVMHRYFDDVFIFLQSMAFSSTGWMWRVGVRRIMAKELPSIHISHPFRQPNM